MSKKIVVNACFGGFGLSIKAVARLVELGSIIGRPHSYKSEYDGSVYEQKYTTPDEEDRFMHRKEDKATPWPVCYEHRYYDHPDERRSDPLLVKVVEELGDAASGDCAHLVVFEVDDGDGWYIEEYDGSETLETKSGHFWYY